MVMDMNIISVGLSAFIGGTMAAVLGWVESKEKFDIRKFGASLIRSAVAGAVFAIGYAFSGEVSVKDILIAFVAGIGADAGLKRAGLGS